MPVKVNVLVEVAGIADFLGDGDEVLQRLGDGSGRTVCFEQAETDGKDRADNHNTETHRSGGGSRGFGPGETLADVRFGLGEHRGGFWEPGCRILLQVKNLQCTDGGFAAIALAALRDEGL